GPQAHHRAAAGAQSQLPLQPVRLRRTQPSLAVPELQAVGHHQAAAQFRGGVNVPAPPSAAAALFLGPAAAGAGLTWLALRYARRRGLLDEPGERRSHSVATPRGGRSEEHTSELQSRENL